MNFAQLSSYLPFSFDYPTFVRKIPKQTIQKTRNITIKRTGKKSKEEMNKKELTKKEMITHTHVVEKEMFL